MEAGLSRRRFLAGSGAGALGLLWLGAGAGTRAAQAPDREALGRAVKYRVLVDKVMQPTRDWVTEAWMVDEAARCGFNVFVPRRGHDRLDEVRRVAAWCRGRGLFYMPWMRGTLSAPRGEAADGRRLVWADGTVEDLWSPNAPELWRWLHRHIVAYAEIAKENPHLVGVFLDFENYSPSGKPNCYDLSYDRLILEEFAAARGLALPDLPPGRRRDWLRGRGLEEAFAAFQVAAWRRRCRALRQAVDRHDPAFRFCVYPAPGTRFITEAVYPEWATPRAPLVLADAVTYGNPGGSLALRDGLEANRRRLRERRRTAEAAGIPFFYLGGIDPAVAGAEPEFSGKNADAIAEVADGYWVFYEGPRYDYAGPDPTKDHRAYFHWFALANRSIASGRFDLWRQPRQTPHPALVRARALVKALERQGLAWAGGAGSAPTPAVGRTGGRPAPLTFRGLHAFVVVPTPAAPLAARLQVRRVGRYESGCDYLVMDLGGAVLARGRATPTRPAEVRLPARGAGPLVLVADSGPSAARLHLEAGAGGVPKAARPAPGERPPGGRAARDGRADGRAAREGRAPRGEHADAGAARGVRAEEDRPAPPSARACLLGPRVHLLGPQPRAFFLVEPEAERVRVAMETPSPGETARLRLIDPTGRVAAEADTLARRRVKAQAAVPPTARGRPWAIDLGRARRGTCEDIVLELLDGAVPLLATDPSALPRFAAKRPG